MYAVVFEVLPSANGMQRYLDIAAGLRPHLEQIDGFLSVVRYRCLNEPGWLLSLSMWRDEEALVHWRMQGEHRAAQAEGRIAVFDDYRLRVVRFPASPEAATDTSAPRLGLREHDGSAGGMYTRRFAGLIDAHRHADLVEAGDEPDVRWGEVIRDYGMRARAQAPQSFPDLPRRQA